MNDERMGLEIQATKGNGDMATVKRFEELGVWQDSRQLVRAIYSLSKRRSFYQDCGLREQIRRAASSTMSNIAEGFERGTRKEFLQFLNISKGSNGEVRSQAYVALDQGYLSQTEFESLRDSATALSRRLASFIRYLEGCSGTSRVRKPGSRIPEEPATCNLQPATN
jgi:four helix bundle protein